MTPAELDALPEGDAAVLTVAGTLWIKGDENMWVKPLRGNKVKVRTSAWLAQCNPLTLVHPAPADPTGAP